MGIDRFFTMEAEVSSFDYQLGLDRDPAEDLRSPRQQKGDPRTCNRLEATNRLANASTNFAIGWLELISDYEKRTLSCEYVEDLILIGVPPTHYAYSIVGHDEAAESETNGSWSPLAIRSAAHGKIINLRLPSGGFLQPIYPKKDRMLTTLFFAKYAITMGRAHPLDRDRIRNLPKHFLHGTIPQFKRELDAAVKAAHRFPDGSPDPMAIMVAMHQLGLEDVFAKVGLFGRLGVSIALPGHPRRLQAYGPEFEALHKFILTKEPINHESKKTDRFNSGNEFFPRGCLDRSPEYADRISNALNEWRAARVKFNRRRYNLDRPTMVFGCPDLGAPVGLGLLDRLPPFRMPVPEGAASGDPSNARELEGAVVNQPTKTAQPVSPTQQIYEHPKPRTTAKEGRNPDLCGAHADLGVSIPAIIATAARMVLGSYLAVKNLHRAIDAYFECRSQLAQSREEGTRAVSVACGQLSEASRRLDAAIEQRSVEATPVNAAEAVINEDGPDPYESVQIVSRPLPTPRSGPKPSIEH